MIGEKLGSFRIESVIGTGSTAMVYRATNEKSGAAAAVKVLRNDLPDFRVFHSRFEREAAILQQLRHPNIVRFLAVGRFRETNYLAMEFIQGATIEKIIQDRGRLSWEEAVAFGIQVCDALEYLHAHGVVHRDLKPSELMVTADGQLKVIDFGIAKDLDAVAITVPGRTLGTPAYMSPEQIHGTPAISHRTDLYLLGGVLYAFLVGRPPFEASTSEALMQCHLNDSPPRASDSFREIPAAFDDLILKLLAKSPTDRPRDARAVKDELSACR
jgi:serine/threonine-protein kinase